MHFPGPEQRRPGSDSQPPRVAIVSSGLGRWPHRHRDWFTALATVCRDLLPPASRLLSVPGTTVQPYLSRCAGLFDHRIDEVDATGTQRHERDRLAVSQSDLVVILSARPGSRTQQLIETLLTNPPVVRPEIWSATDPSLARRFSSLGWKARLLHPVPVPDCHPVPISSKREPGRTRRDDRSLEPHDWLLHCTRECSGPWPGQSRRDYLDDLILGRPPGDHSVLASLLRIIAQRRLRAVSRPVQGGPLAVSFSACPLASLASRRIFRPHRGRWDFEPYGIAISRNWLSARGGRPVIYRPPDSFSGDDPFEQPTHARTQPKLDWTLEAEWRHLGDLDLRSLSATRGRVFVASEEDARTVDPVSPWPVVVLGRFRQDGSSIQ
ncbi:MAG: hypothetical protein QF363_15880 [Planctomycetaceae bacterium]|nr:hypothetical protein [Planctomycetaceae bacterium]